MFGILSIICAFFLYFHHHYLLFALTILLSFGSFLGKTLGGIGRILGIAALVIALVILAEMLDFRF